MNTNIEQLTREIHDTFSNNQLDKTLEFVSDNVKVSAYAFGLSFQGREGFAGFIQGLKTAFPDIVINHTNLISSGNQVAVELIAHGTHTGPLHTPNGIIPPSGRKVDFTVSEFMVWEHDKLVNLHNYQDAGSIMRQIQGE